MLAYLTASSVLPAGSGGRSARTAGICPCTTGRIAADSSTTPNAARRFQTFIASSSATGPVDREALLPASARETGSGETDAEQRQRGGFGDRRGLFGNGDPHDGGGRDAL